MKSVITNKSLVSSGGAPPVIVVGLPRSGSSYLAHVLSCMKGLFVFDDLYPYQKAQASGVYREKNLQEHPEKLQKFIEALTWQLRAKIKFEKNFYVPDLSWDDTFEMEPAVFQAVTQESVTWPRVLEEWMVRLATLCGKERWGYKTPQDFLYMKELTTLFPGAKFIYILRDPRKVMLSYKNLPKKKTHGSQDGESGAYHPLAYSLYWKKAYDSVRSFVDTCAAPVEFVRFEDLVQSPEAVSLRLANFLDTEVEGNVVLEKGNSSSSSGKHDSLTKLEVFLCEKLAGSPMEAAGYSLSGARPRFMDVWDFLCTSLSFAIYQAKRFATDKRARGSITAFLGSLFTKKRQRSSKS